MRDVDRVLHTVCTVLLKLVRMDQKPGAAEGLAQFVKFGLIGVSNTLLSYVINIAALWLLAPYHISWDYVLGNLIAFVLSVAWSFYWNSRYVFRLRDRCLKALLKTYASYSATGIVLNNLLSWLWIEQLNISKYVAPIINLVVSVPLNFIINKFWAFR